MAVFNPERYEPQEIAPAKALLATMLPNLSAANELQTKLDSSTSCEGLKEKFAVLVNSSARSGRSALMSIRERVGEQAAFVAALSQTRDLDVAFQRAEQEGIRELWVGGGDGTVGSAAGLCLGKDIRIGILPLGTGNALARELGIPLDPLAAIDFLLETAQPRAIDLGMLNGKPFVTVATLGLTSRIVESLSNPPKGRFGRLAYLPAIFQALKTFSTLHVDVETDSSSFSGRIAQLVMANTRLHAGPFVVTDHAKADDGLISMYVVAQNDRRGILRYGWALATGRQTNLGNVWSDDTSHAIVTCRRNRKFVLDGDPFRARRAVVQSLRQAITVLA